MLVVKIIGIVLFVVIGFFSVKREYKNSTSEEKEQLKRELRYKPIYTFFHSLTEIGYVLVLFNIFFNLLVLRYIGFILIGIGLIIDGADEVKTNNKRGAVVLVILGSTIFLITVFFASRSYSLMGV